MKVGDKVRIVKDMNDHHERKVFSVGTIGTIAEYHEFGYDYPYRIFADGVYWWYPEDAFEIV